MLAAHVRTAPCAQETKSDLAAFVLAYPGAAFLLGESGICTYANVSGLMLLEKSKDEVVGRPVLRWFDARTQLAAADWIFKLYTGEGVRTVVDVRTGSGGLLTVEITGAVAGAGGEIALFLVPYPKRSLVDRAVEQMGSAMLLLDPDLIVTWANPAVETVYGYPIGRMIGWDVWQLVDVEDRTDLVQIQNALRVLRERGSWRGRVRARRREDNEAFWVELWLCEVAREGGALAGYSVNVRDLTAEIEREQQASRAAKLASAGQLLSSVAHEMNNPLASIGNFIHLMLAHAGRNDVDRQMLTLMHREAERLGRIVTDLRTMVRSDEDTRVERGPVDLNEIVCHTIEARRFRLDALNIEVETGLGDIRPVFADRTQIEQVLLNLVVNAEQAMDGQERARRIRVTTEASVKGARFVIEDTGPGIPDPMRERILDPFYTSKGPGDGIGLGLSLVYSIVAAHSGEMRVAEAASGGARFEVELPLARTLPPDLVRAVAVTDPADSKRPKQGFRILLVDDEEVLRTSIRGILALDGHDVDEAVDGAQAIERIDHALNAGWSYDVILSDLRMAGLGGERLLALLRERGDGLDRRVIFITGDTASSGATRLLSDVPVIYKPFRPDQVLAAVRTHVEQLKVA